MIIMEKVFLLLLLTLSLLLLSSFQVSAEPAQQQKNLLFETPTPGPSITPTPTLNPTQLLSVSPTIPLIIDTSQTSFDFYVFVILSFVYIMVIHFAINTGSEFVTFLIIVGFVLGGFLGYWFKSFNVGFVFGIIWSLMFFGGPQKEM